MTSIAKAASLYEQDFLRWSTEQAETLRDLARAGTNLPLDWENLAEEVESLGISQRKELRSRIATIIEHLLKLELSPAAEPRAGWGDTVDRERREIEVLLEASPSLRRETPALIEIETRRGKLLVARSLERHGEATPQVLAAVEAISFTAEEVLGGVGQDSHGA